MKISSISLRNFRQFLGDNVIDFTPDLTSGMSIVIGVNGAGKTTLLSALHFALQGELIDALPHSDYLCHKEVFSRLLDGEESSISVGVSFEDLGESYTVERTSKIRKIGDIEQRFADQVEVFNHTSNSYISLPQRWINSKFPSNLAKFFFFPGENLGDFFSDEKFEMYLEDIKTLSGLDKTELILSAGASVLERLSNRIKSIPGDSEIQNLMETAAGLKVKFDLATEALKDTREKHNTLLSEKRTLDSYLIEQAKKLDSVKEITEIALELKTIESENEADIIAVDAFIAESGWVSFTKDLHSEIESKLSEMSELGQVESRWNPDSITDLINSGKCICGCELPVGSTQRQHLESLLERNTSQTGLSLFDFNLLKSSMVSGAMSYNNMRSAWRSFAKRARQREIQVEALTARRQAIQDSPEIANLDTFLAQKLSRQSELEKEIPEAVKALSDASERLAESQKQVSDNAMLISNADAAKGDYGVLIRQRNSLQRVLLEIEKMSLNMSEKLRHEIEFELRQKLPEIYYFEPVLISVDPEFRVFVTRDGKPFVEAQGQKKARAFCLVVALNKVARDFAAGHGDRSQVVDTDFPLVIDAGFGELSTIFAKLVVRWLESSSSQVVVLVKDDDANGVLDSLDSRKVTGFSLLHMYRATAGINIAVPILKQDVEVVSFSSETDHTKFERRQL